MASQQFCSAPYCRFSHTHVLAAHRCSLCKLNGHSQPQCGKYYRTDASQMSVRIPVHCRCTVQGCHFPTYHTSEGHCCVLCGQRDGTHLKLCPIIVPQFDKSSFIKSDSKPSSGHYMSEYGGQGCQNYCRNNHGTYEYFFLHGDSYGQYGEDTSELPLVNAFTLGYINNSSY